MPGPHLSLELWFEMQHAGRPPNISDNIIENQRIITLQYFHRLLMALSPIRAGSEVVDE